MTIQSILVVFHKFWHVVLHVLLSSKYFINIMIVSLTYEILNMLCWEDCFTFLHCILFCLFLSNLLGWHQLIKLYRFQVYNSIKHYLYKYYFFTIPSQFLSITIYSPFALFYHHPLLPFPSDNHHTAVSAWVFWVLFFVFA